MFPIDLRLMHIGYRLLTAGKTSSEIYAFKNCVTFALLPFVDFHFANAKYGADPRPEESCRVCVCECACACVNV